MTTGPRRPIVGSSVGTGAAGGISSGVVVDRSSSDPVVGLERLRRAPGRGDQIARPVQVVAWVVVVACVLFGLAIRGWILFHVPLTSDEAVTGISAQQILHGHLSVFYPGVAYGGLEQYLYAAFFVVLGQSGMVIHVGDTVFWALAAVLTWRVARHLVSSPGLAALAGALAWAGPWAGILTSSIETGYRGTATDCGLGCLLVVLRMLEGKRGPVSYCSLGLLAGLGLWSTPEVVYFLLPVGLILLSVLAREVRRDSGVALAGIGVLVGSFVVGALPSIWWNLDNGLRSFRPGTLSAGNSPLNPGFVGRLHLFFRYTVPMDLGLRLRLTGLWLFGNQGSGIDRVLLVVVVVLAGAASVVALCLCLAGGGRLTALGIAVVLFPLLYAAFPASWYWQDGRYALFLLPLMCLVAVVGCEQGVGLITRLWRAHPPGTTGERAGRRVAPLVAIPLAVLWVVLSGAGLHETYVPTSGVTTSNGVALSDFFRSWTDPDRPSQSVVADLEALHVRFGFAEYWVAYKLDFLSRGKLVIATSGQDTSYIPSIQHQATDAQRQAWIFVPNDHVAAAVAQFADTAAIVGPDGESEADFVAKIRALGVPFTVAHAGLVDVVITSKRIDERTVGTGLPGPTLASG